TPEHIREAGKRALDEGHTRYTAVTGTMELRRAIAARSTARRSVPCVAEQVVVSVGAKHALFNLALALYEPGDEVIIPAPYWVSYPEQVRLVGATPVIVVTPEATGSLMRAALLQQTRGAETNAVIRCTPWNP